MGTQSHLVASVLSMAAWRPCDPQCLGCFLSGSWISHLYSYVKFYDTLCGLLVMQKEYRFL